jgi:hypothetical protein
MMMRITPSTIRTVPAIGRATHCPPNYATEATRCAVSTALNLPRASPRRSPFFLRSPLLPPFPRAYRLGSSHASTPVGPPLAPAPAKNAPAPKNRFREYRQRRFKRPLVG